MSLQLRPYQRAAIEAIYEYFGRASGHPLVVIPTAGGKSLVMAEFIREVLEAWPDQRILIRGGQARVCMSERRSCRRRTARSSVNPGSRPARSDTRVAAST